MTGRHRMYLRGLLVVPALVLAIVVTCVPACAQGSSSAGAGETGEIRLSGEDVLSAVRISVLNGVIDYVNGAKHARLAVEWELLPVDPLLKEDAAGELVMPQMVKIPNAVLTQDPPWSRRFPPALVAAISHDLGRPLDPDRVAASDLDRWHEAFLAGWLTGAKAQVAKRGLLPRTYYALLRDHNLLYFVLRGNGIGFYLDADSRQPVSGLPRVTGEGITWVIRQYSFLVDRADDVWVYRYGIRARLEPFDIYLSNLTQEKITLSAQVGIRPSDISVGLLSRLVPLEGFEVQLEAPRQERIDQIETGGALQRVNALLDLFGAPELGTLVTQGLLGGSEHTSLVSGVMAARGGVGGFVGANTDLRQLGSQGALGLLFGLDPRQSDALYLGPSLRTRTLLVSVGARVSSQRQAGEESAADRGLRGELSGVLSLDLGGLFGARREITAVRLAASQVGGDWGVSSDFIGAGLGYAEISYPDPADPPLEAVQLTDAGGAPVDAKTAQVLYLAPQPGVRRLFLPAGAYRLVIPEGRRLLDQGFPVIPGTLQVGGQAVEGYFLIIPWETAVEVSYDLR
jgi:hypothetical protein